MFFCFLIARWDNLKTMNSCLCGDHIMFLMISLTAQSPHSDLRALVRWEEVRSDNQKHRGREPAVCSLTGDRVIVNMEFCTCTKEYKCKLQNERNHFNRVKHGSLNLLVLLLLLLPRSSSFSFFLLAFFLQDIPGHRQGNGTDICCVCLHYT